MNVSFASGPIDEMLKHGTKYLSLIQTSRLVLPQGQLILDDFNSPVSKYGFTLCKLRCHIMVSSVRLVTHKAHIRNR
jgi:hypothetical protein